MATGFFDMITSARGDLYVFEARSRKLREKIPFTFDQDLGLQSPKIPADVTESYVSLPLGLLDFRVLELELEDIDKVVSVLPYELDTLILSDPSDVVIDGMVFDPAGGEKKVLAAYVEKSALKALLSSLEKINMDPRGITSIDTALALEVSSNVEELVNRLAGEEPEGQYVAEGTEGEERIASVLLEINECTVNFRRGEFSFRKDAEKTRYSLRFAAVLAIMLTLVFSVNMTVNTFAINSETSTLEKEMLSAYSLIFPGRKDAFTPGLAFTMRAELLAIKKKDATFQAVSPLEFLMQLEKLNSPSLNLTVISFDNNAIALKGEATSLSDVERFRHGLEGFLEGVIISDSGQAVSGKVAFSIRAKEKKVQEKRI